MELTDREISTAYDYGFIDALNKEDKRLSEISDNEYLKFAYALGYSDYEDSYFAITKKDVLRRIEETFAKVKGCAFIEGLKEDTAKEIKNANPNVLAKIATLLNIEL